MWILRLQIFDGTRQSNTHGDPQSTLYVFFHYLMNYIELGRVPVRCYGIANNL